MKDKEYWVIKPTEDGAMVYNMDKNSLHTFIERHKGWEFIDSMENSPGTDPNYWGKTMLIIKGSIVEPKPVEVVTRYSID